MLHRVWTLLRDTVEGFVNDGAMSRGAAIAYYTVFSLAPGVPVSSFVTTISFVIYLACRVVGTRRERRAGRRLAPA